MIEASKMTVYEYGSQESYTSESSPVKVVRIPPNKYRVTAKYGNMERELVYITSPGVQKLLIEAVEPDWDLSGISLLFAQGAGYLTVSGYSGTTPKVAYVILQSGSGELIIDTAYIDFGSTLFMTGATSSQLPNTNTTIHVQFCDRSMRVIAENVSAPYRFESGASG